MYSIKQSDIDKAPVLTNIFGTKYKSIRTIEDVRLVIIMDKE